MIDAYSNDDTLVWLPCLVQPIFIQPSPLWLYPFLDSNYIGSIDGLIVHLITPCIVLGWVGFPFLRFLYLLLSLIFMRLTLPLFIDLMKSGLPKIPWGSLLSSSQIVRYWITNGSLTKSVLLWGLLQVFLPKACMQWSLCRWSIAQLFEATAELGL